MTLADILDSGPLEGWTGVIVYCIVTGMAVFVLAANYHKYRSDLRIANKTYADAEDSEGYSRNPGLNYADASINSADENQRTQKEWTSADAQK